LHALTEAQVIAHILDELDMGRGGVVVTPNLDHLRRYCHDLTFGAIIAEADLIVADGMPLVWASRLQATPLPERVPGSNLISSLSAAAGAKGRSIFLLGGDPGTAEGAAAVLQKKYPSCIVAGWHFPPFGFQDDPKQMAEIVQKLSDAKPDIVYVALGSPKQEKLIGQLRPILPNSWWLGVGNSFSFLAGHVKRAPVWMQHIGAEWLHRLAQEPRRLFRRYLIIGVPFAASLLTRSTMKGVPNRFRRFRRKGRVEGAAVGAIEPSQPNTQQPTPPPPVVPIADARPARIEAPSIVTSTGSDQPHSLSRLRALVLLGGSVRASQLSACIQRSILDLPLDSSGTILNHWLGQAQDVARWASLDRLPVRVMVNQYAPEPGSGDARFFGSFRVERDLSDYRGTGGLLHDLTAEYEDDDLILMANAAQVLMDPLPAIASALHTRGGDVTVVSHEDGTPSGIMLMSCKALRLIPPRGFVDMKEQGLPLIASKYDVRVLHRRRPTGLPVRTLGDYIQALRFHHRRQTGTQTVSDPLAEDWTPTFSLIEDGASVAPTARVHDSVVLKGAKVESGAVVVRSVVCPNAIVLPDRTEVDQLVEMGKSNSNKPRRRQVLAGTK
ncbi:MAG TPA: WecB/TagA/CpsF family glycosyltransferase, partial [Tepidisphaeraceae bacterium]|nr:WecB/TagA/CpsF family glycosyltransferase [Tepidisphaeraceae bacterium]